MSQIIALHGFLGLPSDWEPFQDRLAGPSSLPNSLPVSLKARSLWKDLRLISSRFQSKTGTDLGSLFSPLTHLAFDFWAHQFTQEVERKRMANVSENPSPPGGSGTGPVSDQGNDARPILMGYSLGGRLAMHALALRPELFRGAIFISAHPGLPEPEAGGVNERLTRFQNDHLWMERFLNWPWTELVSTWEAQTVLAPPPGGPPSFERKEADFDRLLLADALTSWSLARQKDLRICVGLRPTLLITGEFDPKFTRLTAEWVKTHARATHVILPGAGHRAPWDQPELFVSAVQNWLAAAREDLAGSDTR